MLLHAVPADRLVTAMIVWSQLGILGEAAGQPRAHVLAEAATDCDVRLDAPGARRVRRAGPEVVDHRNGLFYRTIDAARRTNRLERGARVDGARANLIDLRTREADRQEEEDVLARERGVARHVDLEVIGIAVGMQRDAPAPPVVFAPLPAVASVLL